MELRHLHSFLALAEELHFGRAADRLGIAQPPLSRHIQLLEAEIGASLFERSPRAVRLTAAGEELRNRVKAHVDGISSAVNATRLAAAGKTGRLSVGFTSNLSYLLLPAVLERLKTIAPGVSFHVSEMSTDPQIDALRSGEIELGLLALPIDEPDLIQRRLFQDPLLVVMPHNHPLAGHDGVTFSQLKDYPFVMCPRYRRTGFQHVITDRCVAAGFTPRVVQEVEGKTLMYELVARGVGVSIVPRSSSHGHREGFVYLPILDPVEPVDIAAVWRKENDSCLRRLFVDTAVAVAAEVYTPKAVRAVA